jgi:hypothetical protein
MHSVSFNRTHVTSKQQGAPHLKLLATPLKVRSMASFLRMSSAAISSRIFVSAEQDNATPQQPQL